MSRVAVVTGGASGIGQAISQRLAKRGNKVAIFDQQGDSAECAGCRLCRTTAFRPSRSRSTSPTGPRSTPRSPRSVTSSGLSKSLVTSAGVTRIRAVHRNHTRSVEPHVGHQSDRNLQLRAGGDPRHDQRRLGPDRDDLLDRRPNGCTRTKPTMSPPKGASSR